MQGHGYAQPAKEPPHTAWLVLLRVVFVAVAVLSLGFLAWVTQLRLALVTRKSLDWGLFVAVLAADVLSVVLVGNEPGDEIQTVGGYLGLLLLLGTLTAVVAYYLAADIRHFQRRRRAYAHGPAVAAYGYPGPASPAPFTATTVPTAPFVPQPPLTRPVQPHAPVPPAAPVSQPPAPVPAPQRPQPARIDQVRAELDELSDYLRKNDARRDSAPGSAPGGMSGGFQGGSTGGDDHEGGR